MPVSRPGVAVPTALFRRTLAALATANRRRPLYYRWPESLALPEAELQRLWIELARVFGWFDAAVGRPEPDVRIEVEYVFGQSPYYFLKPWVRPELTFPLRWGRQLSRTPHAFVQPGYRAMRPGPNIAHFKAEFEDALGRGYMLGTELTSDAPIMYYRRGPRMHGDPARGDVLVLRHVFGLRRPDVCAGHTVTVERTRILPRAATGVVCLEDYGAVRVNCGGG
jgi:hypothetical protein